MYYYTSLVDKVALFDEAYCNLVLGDMAYKLHCNISRLYRDAQNTSPYLKNKRQDLAIKSMLKRYV